MIHVYTGDGKGKTTAAFGLAMRARAHGKRVLIVQFLKGELSGEAKMAEKMGIEVVCRAEPRGFLWDLNAEQQKKLSENTVKTFDECVSRAGELDMLVLDEIICAVDCGMIGEDKVLAFLGSAPPGLEIVLTGRGAPPGLVAAADYVSLINCVKHPFDKGVSARRGIEY